MRNQGSPLHSIENNQTQIMLNQLLSQPQQPGNDSSEIKSDAMLLASFTTGTIFKWMFGDHLLLSQLTPIMNIPGAQVGQQSPGCMMGVGLVCYCTRKNVEALPQISQQQADEMHTHFWLLQQLEVCVNVTTASFMSVAAKGLG